jgi:hypothetical protein
VEWEGVTLHKTNSFDPAGNRPKELMCARKAALARCSDRLLIARIASRVSLWQGFSFGWYEISGDGSDWLLGRQPK